jgi:4-nitrophenyl phosphatase
MSEAVPTSNDLRTARAFLFDMDGVLYRGERALPGAREVLDLLRARGVPHLFLTNNASRTPEQVTEKLRRMGIRAAIDQVLTSAEVAVADLARTARAEDRVFVVGGAGIRAALAHSPLYVADHYQEATIVLVGLDRGCTYERLAQAGLAIQRGARFCGTNGDRSYPTERGLEPGAGALLAVIEATTGVRPQLYGKPAPAMFDAAFARLGIPPHQVAMVGDRHETDIAGGARAGCITVAVASGVETEAQLRAGQPAPHHVFTSVADLHQVLLA